jgi:hypothetical protein
MLGLCLQAKLKTPGQLQELLDITRELLAVSDSKGLDQLFLSCSDVGAPPTICAAHGNLLCLQP